jgi:hypothetical protein
VIVAIMQPYLFPYLGYMQLVAACDRFVAFDDVKYAKHTWVNRNRILDDGAARWFTLPVARASHLARIDEREYHLGRGHQQALLERIETLYRHAPQFPRTFDLLRRVLAFPDPNVAAFNINALRMLCEALGIATPISVSSGSRTGASLHGQDRVLEICSALGADTYVNSIGGTALYDAGAFAARGISLRFLESRAPAYRQFGDPFVPGLSIIDVLMFNDDAAVRAALDEYRLLDAEAAGVREARAADA